MPSGLQRYHQRPLSTGCRVKGLPAYLLTLSARCTRITPKALNDQAIFKLPAVAPCPHPRGGARPCTHLPCQHGVQLAKPLKVRARRRQQVRTVLQAKTHTGQGQSWMVLVKLGQATCLTPCAYLRHSL